MPRPSAPRLFSACFFSLFVVSSVGSAQAAPAAAAVPPGAPPPATVSLPLAEYEKLVSKPAVTVIDTLRLTGSFAGKDLGVLLVGRSAGYLPRAEVLGGPSGLRIFGCEGEAVLSRNAAGVFEVLPQAPRFSLRCRLVTASSDRLQLETAAAVLWTESTVSDGELVPGEESHEPGGRRSYAVVRVTGGTGEPLPPTASARYRISILPESKRFAYQLELRNPNRSHASFTVRLKSGEVVDQVKTTASFEPNGSEYRFDLPPGEVSVELLGTLQRTAFVPPIPASVQYVLIESHPLVRPVIPPGAGGPRRISPSETGLAARYRGAQGFLLGDGDTLSWEEKKLDVLRTTSFAVPRAQHTFFIAADGTALGETQLSIENQGAPSLSLPLRAEWTYAEVAHEPTLLTKNQLDQLWLPLGQGSQDVLLQHRQSIARSLGFAFGTLALPELSERASSASIDLRYPREWVPLYEEFAPELRLPIFDLGGLVLLLFLVLWTERVLAALRLGLATRILTAALLSLASLSSGALLALLILVDLAVSALWAAPWVMKRRWGFWSSLLALGAAGGVFLIGSLVLLTMRSGMAPRSEAPIPVSSSTSKVYSRDVTTTPAAGDAPVEGQVLGGVTFQGLPAKFAMPWGHDRSYYHREMLATDQQRSVRVLLISRVAVSGISTVCLLLGLLYLLYFRRLLRLGGSELIERIRHPEKE